MRTYCVISLILIGFLGYVTVARCEDRVVLHEEFAGLLFDHLELSKPGIAINQTEKIDALVDLNFKPGKGYIEGQKMTMGELAEVLINVYGLGSKLSKDTTQADMISLLVDEKILPEKVDPSKNLDYDFTLDIVRKIPMGPNTVPKTVLLPRIPVEPPLSRVD